MTGLPWLIVDGYNVIGSLATLGALSAEELDVARERLVTRVAGFAQDSYRAVVVFDAAANPKSDGRPRHVCGIAVVFTAAGSTADQTIEMLARRARTRREAVIVVTSDADTQWTVLGEGGLRMSSREFVEALDERQAENAARATSGTSHGRLGDRLDEATRRRLSSWARGG